MAALLGNNLPLPSVLVVLLRQAGVVKNMTVNAFNHMFRTGGRVGGISADSAPLEYFASPPERVDISLVIHSRSFSNLCICVEDQRKI